jgi:hypothetical protein
MRDKPSAVGVAQLDDEVERVVLALLLDSRSAGPWSMQELAVAIGSALQADVAVVGLHASGLVHRCHEFVWVTRPAWRFHVLAGAA